MNRLLGLILITGMALLQAGCSILPSAAPTSGQVSKPVTLGDGSQVELIDLVENSWRKAATENSGSRNTWSFADGYNGAGEIMAGDRLNITIFEIGYSLFGRTGNAASGKDSERPVAAAGNALPAVEVPASGIIRLPYMGQIKVLGRSAQSVAAEIKGKMRGLSQQAEILVSVTPGPMRAVTVTGAVKAPGRQSLTMAGERLLDAIALAGGPIEQPANIYVRLTRQGKSEELRLDEIYAEDPANVRLMPGDTVQLIKNSRTMTVIGAARNVSEVAIDEDDLSLVEALARAGGPLDSQADATGVFVFRFAYKIVDEKAVQVPTIYRLNLLDPRAYFIASRFGMRDDDIILIANAKSAQFGKLVQLLNQFTSPIVTAELLTR